MSESDGSARLHGQAQHRDPGDTRSAIGSGRGDFDASLESAGDPAGNAGAGEGIRTLDPDLGKVVLYP